VERLATIKVEGFEELSRLGGGAPTSIVDAQFHAPHLAALELLGRSPQNGLRDADLADPRLAAPRERVELRHNPPAHVLYYKTGQLPVRVTLTTQDGAERSIALENPTGSPLAGGLSRDDLTAKFMALAVPALGQARAERVVAAVDDLESVPAREIAALI